MIQRKWPSYIQNRRDQSLRLHWVSTETEFVYAPASSERTPLQVERPPNALHESAGEAQHDQPESCIHVYICIYIYVCICIHIYAHTVLQLKSSS